MNKWSWIYLFVACCLIGVVVGQDRKIFPQRVGIGTNNPANTLHVQGSAKFDANNSATDFQVSSYIADEMRLFWRGGTGGLNTNFFGNGVGSIGSQSFSFFTVNTQRWRVTGLSADGVGANLGDLYPDVDAGYSLGTPNRRLLSGHFNDVTITNGNLQSQTVTTVGAGSTAGKQTFYGTAGSAGPGVTIGASDSGTVMLLNTNQWYLNSTNGNLGNTNLPQAKLHVAGAVIFDGIWEPVGLVLGAGQSQATRLANRAALALAATNAQSSGRLLRLPPGIIETEFDASNTGIVVTNLICTGAGKHQTILTYFPEAPGFAYYGFSVSAGGRLILRDVTLKGPTNTASASTAGVHYNGYADSVTNSFGYTLLENVIVATNFSRAFQSDAGSVVTNHGGDVTHEFVDCDFSADSQGVAVFSGNGIKKKLHARGTYFRKAGTTDQHHLIYVHPIVDMALSNCRFGQTALNGYGIHNYSGSTDLINNYNYVENCVFESGVSQGILNEAPMRIAGCEFRTSRGGIIAGNTNWVTGCLFRGTNTATYMFSTYGSSPIETTMRDCSFYSPLGMSCAVGSASNVTWQIYNTIFACTGPGLLLNSDGVTCHLTGGEFLMNGRGIDCSASDLFVRDVSFRGDATIFFGAIRLQGTTVTNIVTVNDCRFLSTTRGMLTESGWVGKLSGANNDFGGTDLEQSSDVRHYIQARSGLFTNAVASAGSVSLNASYDIFRVTGTTTIDNIYMGNASEVKFFGGTKLQLIVDGTWVTSSSGNLRPLTTAARTSNTVARLVYDSVTGLWYE